MTALFEPRVYLVFFIILLFTTLLTLQRLKVAEDWTKAKVAPLFKKERSNSTLASLSFLAASNLSPLPSAHRSICERRYPNMDHMKLSYVIPPLHPTRYYIAINLHNNYGIIIEFITELTRTLTTLCHVNALTGEVCDNVYVSIYSSGNTDSTTAALSLFELFLSSLHIPHTIISNGDIIKRSYRYRIDHLTDVRNAAMKPLYDTYKARSSTSIPPYDRIIFINDVLHCAEDVLRLLSHTVLNDNVSMVCGLDYDDTGHTGIALFYDNWVMRGIEGQATDKRYPYIREKAGREAMDASSPFSVFCCWNGLAILNAADWYEYHLSFRAYDTKNIDNLQSPRCDASECSHVCENYWSIHGRNTHVLVDPMVHVAYDYRVYAQIENQAWFKQQEKHRKHGWSMQDEILMQQREVNVSHALAAWYCCNLNGPCQQHPVHVWNDSEKARRRKKGK